MPPVAWALCFLFVLCAIVVGIVSEGKNGSAWGQLMQMLSEKAKIKADAQIEVERIRLQMLEPLRENNFPMLSSKEENLPVKKEQSNAV